MKILVSFLFALSLSFGFNMLFTQAFMAFQKGKRFVKSNPQKADKFFQKSYVLLSQIDGSSSQKNYILGVLYMNGWGVEQNLNKAEKYLKNALALGNQKSLCALAKLYIKKGNINAAKKYLKKAKANSSASNGCSNINQQTMTIKN